MTEHEIAARAALSDLLEHHRTQITRIEAAVAALNGDTPVVPLVRPPAPDIIAPPVQMPKLPQREQRPAATEPRNRSDAARATAKRRANCPDCGKECSLSGLGTHRRMAHGRTFKPLTTADIASASASAQEIFKCVTCSAVFNEKSKLANHTITTHGRGPMGNELVAISDEVAA